MPKYYVSLRNHDTVLEATDPLDACVKTSLIHSIITVGLPWKVSEIGFETHDGDVFIRDDDIVKEINRRNKKKKKK